MWHTVVHHSSTYQYANFHSNRKTFCGRTDIRTDGQTTRLVGASARGPAFSWVQYSRRLRRPYSYTAPHILISTAFHTIAIYKPTVSQLAVRAAMRTDTYRRTRLTNKLRVILPEAGNSKESKAGLENVDQAASLTALQTTKGQSLTDHSRKHQQNVKRLSVMLAWFTPTNMKRACVR